MQKEKSLYQTRIYSIVMVATVAALAMVVIFFLTRMLTTAKPASIRVEAPSLLKAVEPQVVAVAVPSAESQRRMQSAKAYIALFSGMSRAQQAETARWNGLAGQQANLSGGMSRAQLAEIARWNGLAGQAQGSTSP